MRFTRIAVPGERDLDVDALTAPAPADWRRHVGAVTKSARTTRMEP